MMKTSRHYLSLLAAFFMAALTLSSCLNNDDDNSANVIDKETQHACQVMMSGSHGSMLRMYYPKAAVDGTATAEKFDSLEHQTWTVKSDSTVTLGSFPINKLDSAIYVSDADKSTNATLMRAVQKAISEINTPVTLKSYYFIPYNNSQYVTGDGYNFLVYPSLIKQEVTYNNEKHTLYFVFYGGTLGSWTRLKMDFEYNMLLGGIAVDQYSELTGQGNFISNQYFREVLLECKNK